jgi:hypothetical protein
MKLQINVFDIWAFRRSAGGVEYLLLHTSQEKADRYFNGGRFWQIPSNFTGENEPVVQAVARLLGEFSMTPRAIWAAEHVYTIYNRRFDCMQMIAVYAAEVSANTITLAPAEHSEYRWCSYDQAQSLIHYRGLKDGLRSTQDYVTGPATPARELQLL